MTTSATPIELTLSEPKPRGRLAEQRRSVGCCMRWSVMVGLALNALQVLFEGAEAGVLPMAVVVLAMLGVALVAGMQLWSRRQVVWRTLNSTEFGAATLMLLAMAITAGTVILQAPSAEVFHAKYGLVAPLLTWLQLDQVFQSWWFLWLLGLFAVGLVANVFQARFWRNRRSGFLFAHVGMLLLIFGGVLGSLFGSQGLVQLEVGQKTDRVLGSDGQEFMLPFSVLLSDFQVERRDAEYQVYVVIQSEEAGESRAIASLNAMAPATHSVAELGTIEILDFDPGEEPKKVMSEVGPQLWILPGKQPSPETENVEKAWVSLRLHRHDGFQEVVQELKLGGDGPVSVAIDGSPITLRLAKRRDDIVNFQSTLALFEGERAVTGGPVRVNHPMHYKGFTLYQASYDPKNPRYAGILVVRDPGLPVIYLGLSFLVLGVAWMMLLRIRSDRGSAA